MGRRAQSVLRKLVPAARAARLRSGRRSRAAAPRGRRTARRADAGRPQSALLRPPVPQLAQLAARQLLSRRAAGRARARARVLARAVRLGRRNAGGALFLHLAQMPLEGRAARRAERRARRADAGTAPLVHREERAAARVRRFRPRPISRQRSPARSARSCAASSPPGRSTARCAFERRDGTEGLDALDRRVPRARSAPAGKAQAGSALGLRARHRRLFRERARAAPPRAAGSNG